MWTVPRGGKLEERAQAAGLSGREFHAWAENHVHNMDRFLPIRPDLQKAVLILLSFRDDFLGPLFTNPAGFAKSGSDFSQF
jgi:hypothetical protein